VKHWITFWIFFMTTLLCVVVVLGGTALAILRWGWVGVFALIPLVLVTAVIVAGCERLTELIERGSRA